MSNKKNVQIVFNQMVLKQPKMEKNIFCTCADCRKRKTTFAKTSGSASGRSVERIVNEAANNR